MQISKKKYGIIDNRTIELYTLTNNNGLELNVTNYGCIVTSIKVPDKNGQIKGIVTSWDLTRAIAEGKNELADVITKKVYTTKPEETLEAAARKLALHHISALPVLTSFISNESTYRSSRRKRAIASAMLKPSMKAWTKSAHFWRLLTSGVSRLVFNSTFLACTRTDIQVIILNTHKQRLLKSTNKMCYT